LFESLKAQEETRGNRLIDYAEFRVPENAASVSLDEMRARGELMTPVLGEAHVLSGGFAAAISRGPTIAPTDQRTEFSTTEKGFTVFVTWSPQDRLKGMMSMKLFTADNRTVLQTTPKKSDLKKQDLVLASWQISMPTSWRVSRRCHDGWQGDVAWIRASDTLNPRFSRSLSHTPDFAAPARCWP